MQILLTTDWGTVGKFVNDSSLSPSLNSDKGLILYLVSLILLKKLGKNNFLKFNNSKSLSSSSSLKLLFSIKL